MLYLIEIPHQTTTSCCATFQQCGCILSKFHIKPQQRVVSFQPAEVVSYRNSTSNHNLFSSLNAARYVVSYRNSTSNHNLCASRKSCRFVVSYRNSTSNHNSWPGDDTFFQLYLIEIPHQTTTVSPIFILWPPLYLIEIPHQTTTRSGVFISIHRLYLIEIPHQTTTPPSYQGYPFRCILSKFHIKPQRSSNFLILHRSCILSKFHIKPQPLF